MPLTCRLALALLLLAHVVLAYQCSRQAVSPAFEREWAQAAYEAQLRLLALWACLGLGSAVVRISFVLFLATLSWSMIVVSWGGEQDLLVDFLLLSETAFHWICFGVMTLVFFVIYLFGRWRILLAVDTPARTVGQSQFNFWQLGLAVAWLAASLSLIRFVAPSKNHLLEVAEFYSPLEWLSLGVDVALNGLMILPVIWISFMKLRVRLFAAIIGCLMWLAVAPLVVMLYWELRYGSGFVSEIGFEVLYFINFRGFVVESFTISATLGILRWQGFQLNRVRHGEPPYAHLAGVDSVLSEEQS